MFCNQCGSQVIDDAIFCGGCGRKTDEVVKTNVVSSSGSSDKDHLDFEIVDYARTTSFGYQKVTTTINIVGEEVKIIANFHGKILVKTGPQVRSFKISDIESISYGYGMIIYFIDILRYIVAIILLFAGGSGLLALAIFIYINIHNAIKIKLKNGSTAKIYFDNKHLTTEFVDYINSKLS